MGSFVCCKYQSNNTLLIKNSILFKFVHPSLFLKNTFKGILS